MVGPKICRGLGVVLAGMVGGAVVIPSSYDEALAQAVVGACRPVSERTSEAGCWILAHHSLGELRQHGVLISMSGKGNGYDCERVRAARGT